MHPYIGITLNPDPAYAGYQLRRDYCQCLQHCGLIPLLLPNLPPACAGEVLDKLDGLIISGGGDYPPQCYGQGPWQAPSPRDLWELALLREAWERRMPILGICRGCQGLNIVLGGDLLQELPQKPGQPPHQQSLPRQLSSHPVELCHPFLQQLYGQRRIWVNSFHHQGVGRVAPGLSVAATTPDGVIEALLRIDDTTHRTMAPNRDQLPGAQQAPHDPQGLTHESEPKPGTGWALGLQWHPEALHQLPPFQALAAAARNYASAKR